VMMLTRLVQLGFEPSESLSAVGLPTIAHTGLPTVQLQNPAVLDPEDPESVYPVRDLDPQEFATAVSDAIRGLPAPVVNVTVPEQPARTRKVQRDAAGNITEIVEE